MSEYKVISMAVKKDNPAFKVLFEQVPRTSKYRVSIFGLKVRVEYFKRFAFADAYYNEQTKLMNQPI